MKHMKLANKNKVVSPQSWDLLREKSIVKKIRDGRTENGVVIRKPISENKESALFRKTLKYILDIIRELHDGEIDTEEFMKHYNDIESIIAEVDKELEEEQT